MACKVLGRPGAAPRICACTASDMGATVNIMDTRTRTISRLDMGFYIGVMAMALYYTSYLLPKLALAWSAMGADSSRLLGQGVCINFVGTEDKE